MQLGGTGLWNCAYCAASVDPEERGAGLFVEVHNGGQEAQTFGAHRRCFVAQLHGSMELGPLLEAPQDDPGGA